MSIQSEINRISGNVNDTLGVLSDAGVVVPANANSDNLPDLVSEAVNAIIPIERGGTNGTTKLEAANNLGVPAMWERTKIPNGTDLNTITTPGSYCSQAYLSSTNLVNCPTDKPFIMNVYYACGDKWYTAQEIIDFNEGVRHFRMKGSSNWNPWYANFSVANKPKITDLSGYAIVSQGGTGRTLLTKDCYLVGNNEYGVQLKTKAEVLADIGAASQAELEEVKTSVGEGKALIASAVTDKGVPTADDATFAQMAANIAAIPSGGGGGETVTLTIKPLGPMGITGVLCYIDGEGKSQLATTKGTVTALKGSYASCINGGDGTMQTGNQNLYSGSFGSIVFVVEADGVVKI